jgi:hypothetical protein
MEKGEKRDKEKEAEMELKKRGELMAPPTIHLQSIAPPTITSQSITMTSCCSLVEMGEKRDKEKEAEMELEKRGGLMALLVGIVDNNLAKDEQLDHLKSTKNPMMARAV